MCIRYLLCWKLQFLPSPQHIPILHYKNCNKMMQFNNILGRKKVAIELQYYYCITDHIGLKSVRKVQFRKSTLFTSKAEIEVVFKLFGMQFHYVRFSQFYWHFEFLNRKMACSINKTFFVFHLILMKLGEVVVIHMCTTISPSFIKIGWKTKTFY